MATKIICKYCGELKERYSDNRRVNLCYGCYRASENARQRKNRKIQRENPLFENLREKVLLDARRRTWVSRGIDPDEAERVFLASDKKCEICRDQLSAGSGNLVIDHDHFSGKVRGVLCQRCNRVLGQIKDDPELLQNAIDYLRKTL